MFKHLVICAVLLFLGAAPAVAQQREAVLHRIQVPGGDFEIVVATQKSPASPIYDLSESPDALLVRLIGGELVLAFDDEVKMINAIKTLGSPVSASHIVSKDGKSRMPFAIYVAPKGE